MNSIEIKYKTIPIKKKSIKQKNQNRILTSNVCSSLKTDAEFIALTISKTPLKLFSSWNTNIISIVLLTTDTLSSKFSVSIIHFSSQHINWKKKNKEKNIKVTIKEQKTGCVDILIYVWLYFCEDPILVFSVIPITLLKEHNVVISIRAFLYRKK